jgi:peptidoglycan DL-endopeptidase CwlO
MRRRPPLARALVTAACTVVAALTVMPSTATQAAPVQAAPVQAAPDLAGAQASARALARQVEQLQVRTEIATERYNALTTQLQQVVNRAVVAEQTVDARRATASRTATVADERIRALYMSGGSAALYATVLDSGNISEALTRVGTVQDLVDTDRVRSQNSWRTVTNAENARKQLASLALRRTKLANQAEKARGEVIALLADTKRRMAKADAEVRKLAEQLRAQQQAASEAAARVQLTSLGALGDAPLGNPYASDAITAAQSKVGVPYVWGATGPNTFDCSGLVQWAYRQAGLTIPRVANDQWTSGPSVPLADLRPGDLLFWAYDRTNARSIHHVAMYVGNGQMVEAPRTGLNVRQIPMYLNGYYGAVRPGLGTH